MEIRANYIVVGFCTLGILALGLVFALWISKMGQRTPMREYQIAFEESVSGLSVNNDVLFTGIRVGSVTRIEISKEKPGAVNVYISIAADTPVREDSEASLVIRGVTGVSVVSITAGTVNSPFLTSAGDHIPRIQATPSPLSAAISEVPDLLRSINKTIQSAGGFFSEDNQQAVAATLESVAAITGALAAQQEKLDGIVANVNSMTAKMDAFLGTANTIMERDVRSASRSLADISRRVDESLAKLEPGLTQFSNEGLAEFRMLAVETRNLVRILTRVSRKLENDPRRYLFGEPVQEFTAP